MTRHERSLATAPAAASHATASHAPAEPLIALEGVTKTYRTGALDVTVLHGVSLQIQAGEFVAIIGASGSGKTTLMNILGCLDKPTDGHYRLNGEDVGALDRNGLAALRSVVFGFIFQQYHLLPHATAAENVEIPAIYAGAPHAQRFERSRALLRRLGLGDRLGHRPNQLSGGQQQRVSIARALMNGGQVILADEPTGALDSRSGREVMELLTELNAQGHTIILITHDANVAAVARRHIHIADGRIVSDETVTAAPPASAEAAVPPLRPRRSHPLADLGEALRMGMRSMRANAFRTALTLLGIIIGVGSVIAMQAVGAGAKQDVVERIQAMGTNLLLVRPGAPNQRGAGGPVATMVPDDATAISGLPGVVAAVPEMGGSVTVRFGDIDYQTSITATSADYPEARNWPVARGVFFSQTDVSEYVPVIDLGQTVVNVLFPDGDDPIGKYVLVNNIPFQVIGVMSAKGASQYGSDLDDIAFAPLTTGSLRVLGQRYLRSLTVQVQDVAEMDAIQESIQTLLAARHGSADFQIRNMASILETASATADVFTLLLGSIAAISLLVGGIGVMNIMLVSVTERTREIGIRMATGARTGDIQMQFLAEALVVCAVGGLLGVAGGLGTTWILARFGTSTLVNAAPVLLAFGCAAATGVVFGYLPARKAARLDPVVALSSE